MTQPMEQGYQVVQLLVGDDLAAALEDWSDPVQVRIERSDASPTGWIMTVRTANPPNQECTNDH